MTSSDLRKINHLAIIGFLLPFVAAGVSGVLILISREDFRSLRFSAVYFTVVPLILVGGVIASIKSISWIEERGDKDYAYSGLTMGILFLCAYITSLIYFFS